MRDLRPSLALLALAAALPLGLPAAAGAAARKPAAPRPLAAPAPESPAKGAEVEALPAFTWKRVPGAAQYEFQLAADPGFAAIVLGSGPGKGRFRTRNTAGTVDKTLPDGAYHWRVRAISKTDRPGRWSSTREIVRRWTAQPVLTGPDALAVPWPATPLVLRWNPVPQATNYLVTIASDPELANPVIGSAAKPVETGGNALTIPGTLSPGRWYWAVQPVDNQGHKGTRSRVATFDWAWPTQSAVALEDLDADPGVFDPRLSWAPVPGAASYEVEVNSAEGFPAGSKWCCTDRTTGLSLAPKKVLANNRYFWRVRAVDPEGNAGQWNEGQPFVKSFDADPPAPITNLRVVDADGAAVAPGATTASPVVVWDPVPGASLYEVTAGIWRDGNRGCDFTLAEGRGIDLTATTAWTPVNNSGDPIGAEDWPNPQRGTQLAATTPVCVRVLARTDTDAKGADVTSPASILGDRTGPAFVQAVQPAPGAIGPDGLFTKAGDYTLPQPGAATSATPFFTWKRVPGARSYYVVVARDQEFTKVVDVGYVTAPAYAPGLTRSVPLSDETTSYYWAVLPSDNVNGTGVFSQPADNAPRSFEKSSTAPDPLEPGAGTAVERQPAFRWTPRLGARTYRLQVARDPSFSNPVEDVVTASTSFTSSSTYPADTELLWRVRANDWNGTGLKWSRVQGFQRVLRGPVPAAGNPLAGEQLPVLQWTQVEGAIGYDLHVDQADGTQKDFALQSTAFAPVQFFGTGIWRWKVRARYGSAAGTVAASAYSEPVGFTRTIQPPTGARGTLADGRLLFAWNPDIAAKQFRVEISASDGFERVIASATVDGTSWAPDLSQPALRSGGQFFWRVMAVDAGGNRGAPTRGTLRIGRTLQVTALAAPRRGTRGMLVLRVTDAAGKTVKGVELRVFGRGIRKALKRKTDGRGQARAAFTPPRTGPIVVTARRAGFQTTRATVKVLARPKRR